MRALLVTTVVLLTVSIALEEIKRDRSNYSVGE